MEHIKRNQLLSVHELTELSSMRLNQQASQARTSYHVKVTLTTAAQKTKIGMAFFS